MYRYLAPIGVALAAVAFAAPREADADHGRAAFFFLVPILHALVLNGFFYADVTAPASIALVASPFAGALTLALATNRTRMRIVVAALGVAVALAPFVASEAARYGEEDEYYYDY